MLAGSWHKMAKPIITIHNCETGEVITREMNAEEIAQYEKDTLETEPIFEALNEAQQNRLALLEKLGITEAEARLLLS
jgi:hypothetical protein